MSLIVLAEARKRVPSLPSNDTAAQQIIDEQEAWLARQLGGPLTGERSETFWAGDRRWYGGFDRPHPYTHSQKLRLLRYTDSVVVVDNGVTIDASTLILLDNGSAVRYKDATVLHCWNGPYVVVTYTPNDETEVKRVLYQLIAWEADPPTVLQGERIGSYSYTQATSLTGIKPTYARAALAGELKPKRDPATSIVSLPRNVGRDPFVINLPEPPDYPAY
jgi:hypothetical protein